MGILNSWKRVEPRWLRESAICSFSNNINLYKLPKKAIKTMITNSLGILGARANAECLEDRLGIMVGDGKAAFGRRRSADAANREAYEEYSRHYCSGDGGHAGGRSRT